MKETNPLFVIAEVAMTKKEIFQRLYERAESFIQKKGVLGSGVSRQEVVEHLYKECDRRHWTSFQRKKTVERVASKACRRNHVYRKRSRPRSAGTPQERRGVSRVSGMT